MRNKTQVLLLLRRAARINRREAYHASDHAPREYRDANVAHFEAIVRRIQATLERLAPGAAAEPEDDERVLAIRADGRVGSCTSTTDLIRRLDHAGIATAEDALRWVEQQICEHEQKTRRWHVVSR